MRAPNARLTATATGRMLSARREPSSGTKMWPIDALVVPWPASPSAGTSPLDFVARRRPFSPSRSVDCSDDAMIQLDDRASTNLTAINPGSTQHAT